MISWLLPIAQMDRKFSFGHLPERARCAMSGLRAHGLNLCFVSSEIMKFPSTYALVAKEGKSDRTACGSG